MQDHMTESNKKLTKESNEKSLIDKTSKRLPELKFKSNHSIKYVVKKILPRSQNMQTYCLSCRKHTDNIGSKKSNNGKWSS